MPIIIPGNSAVAGGFDVDNSLRFNKGSSDNLSRTPSSSSAAGRRKFTISAWVKRGNLTAEMGIFSGGPDSNVNGFYTLMFDDADKLRVQYYEGAFYNIMPNRVFRDTSAWYHIVVSNDTTNSTSADRTKIYVNGVQQAVVNASGGAAEQPNVNFDYNVNNNSLQQVGARRNSGGSPAGYFDGYIAEFCMIDNQALAADSFGEFSEDSEIWKPKDVSSLTFGTNGFYLDFEDSSALGNDAAGSNNYTANNLTAIDQTTDTCTNNFTTMNPVATSSKINLTNGNLTVTGSAADDSGNSFSTFLPNQGKWYAEFKVTAISGNSAPMIGIRQEYPGGFQLVNGGAGAGGSASSYEASIRRDGQRFENNSTGSYGVSYTTGDIISIAIDCDNGAAYIAKNNQYMTSGNPESGNSKTGAFSEWTAAQVDNGGQAFAVNQYNGASCEVNFGNPTFTGTDKTDANDRGSFEYAPPSGYLSLCTANLSEVLS